MTNYVRNIGRFAAVSAATTVFASSFAVSVPALAQESSGIGIEEVIVTARKREESAQDVPIAITAISKELQNATIRDLVDLNGFAPNVQIAEDGQNVADVVVILGADFEP